MRDAASCGDGRSRLERGITRRLLLGIALWTIAATVTLALGVRHAWIRAEERRFDAALEETARRLERDLGRELGSLPVSLKLLCQSDALLDRTLLELKRGRLPEERRQALQRLLEDERRARQLDEALLVTHTGEVLASSEAALRGTRAPELARALAQQGAAITVRQSRPPLAVVAACRVEDGQNPALWLGLMGARHLGPLLERAGAAQSVRLSLGGAAPGPGTLSRTLDVEELGALTVVATRSREPLTRTLRELDLTVATVGLGTLGVALLSALLLARGLSAPIVSLAAQARAVTTGEPRPVHASGGRELTELAEAFNRALADLAGLRRRLAATERIAARRELARRVAHEIKNPLAPIQAAVETLRRLRARNDPAFDEYFDEATRTVLGEVARIAAIVNEFSRFARLPPPTLTRLDLAEVAAAVVGLHVTGGARVTLLRSPAPAVLADHDQLVQVLTNLVQNALAAVAAQREGAVVVEVGAFDDARVFVRVSDNGPGVAPGVAERLFEPYVTTKEGGTGLGLAIVQRIVLEHGGDIAHRPAPGGGAVFEVVLPIEGPTLLVEPPSVTGVHGG